VVLALILIAAAIGISISTTAHLFRCRGVGLLVSLGVFCGLAASGTSWWQAARHANVHGLSWVEPKSEYDLRLMRWRVERLSRSLLDRLDEPEPERMRETIRNPTPRGMAGFRWRHGWPERGHDISGFIVLLAWLGELGIFVGFAAWVPFAFVRARPYCEEHGLWMRLGVQHGVAHIDHPALDTARDRGDLDAVLAVPVEPEGPRAGLYSVYRCAKYDEAYLSVLVSWTEKRMFRTRRETDVVVEVARVSPEQVEALAETLTERSRGENADASDLPTLT
jgi:hypothetical protein